ncbi:MAG: phosphatase PAP2 family protein [Proteobacteria bacterium]|nr:phosphatase PAP2 family protein [Pseudomonadota bacterium]
MLLPLALLVALSIGFGGWWRGALAWLLGVGATLGLMFALKVAFIACGPAHVLRSPSGHTAAAAVVCGGLMVVLANRRHWTAPIALLAAVVIGVSRLLLGAHVPLEVLVGAIAGIGGALVIAACAGPMPPYRRSRTAVLAIATLLLLHGLRLPAEAHIRGFAYMVAHMLAVCQVNEDEDALWHSLPPPAAPASATLAPAR